MNFSEARAIAYYENYNPADEACTEDRCVNGKHCEQCNPDLEFYYDKNEYTGDEDDQ
jgi:hypothetical protein